MSNLRAVSLPLLAIAAIGMLASCSTKNVGVNDASIDTNLRTAMSAAGVSTLPSPPDHSDEMMALGQALFFDKELSGNRDISCATCHHTSEGTGDGLSLSFGTGGDGTGHLRNIGEGRDIVPRNAPPTFNRGHDAMPSMFWDSRVNGNSLTGFNSPAGDDLPDGFNHVLEVQAMFPVTSSTEMRGEAGENEVADAGEAGGNTAVWSALTTRLNNIPKYVEMFGDAFPGVNEFGFEHAAMAIGSFEGEAFHFANSPFDRYIAGDDDALTLAEKRGAQLFFGKARCSECHSGPTLSDFGHHNVASPQIGPGKNPDGADFGLFGETNNPADKFAFRTPPLRNVALTGPWMHDGAYMDLESVVSHMLACRESCVNYDVSQVRSEFQDVRNDQAYLDDMMLTLDDRVASPVELTGTEFASLMEFMNALTDPAAEDLSSLLPATVPSGLPVAD